MTLLYNLAMGLLVLATLVAIAKARRRPPFFGAGLVFGGVAVLFLAVLLGEDGFGRLRLLSYGLFVHGPLFLAGSCALLLREHRVIGLGSGILGLSLVAIAVQAFLIEPQWLEVTGYQITTDKLDQPIKIVVISDLQTDTIGAYEEGVLQATLAEQPDLVLLPGDYVQCHDRDRYLALVTELRALLQEVELRPRLGIYAVEGNVDQEGWTTIFEGVDGAYWFDRSGTLTRDAADGKSIRIDGLSLSESRVLHRSIEPATAFHIVLGHYPDFVLGDVQADLLVAGHTHGGQVQLPGFGPPITLSRVPREWAAGGSFDLGSQGHLVVSRGIGMERDHAPRLRFLCRPQLVVIEVTPR